MQATFFKYHALGNDMLVIDPARFEPELTPELIQRLCARHLGIGADGICYGPLPTAAQPLTMRFFNPDGSEAEKSGNGLRIFARYLWDATYVKDFEFTIHINNEAIQVTLADQAATLISTTMGGISFLSQYIPMEGPPREVIGEFLEAGEETVKITAVSVGNPHCIIFHNELSRIRQLGPLLETHPAFPNRTNVQLVRILDKQTIRIEIWERGAGYTLASGSSATATAVAAIRSGLCQSPATVQMAGGSATVTVDERWQATLTGAVTAVFSGQLAPTFLK